MFPAAAKMDNVMAMATVARSIMVLSLFDPQPVFGHTPRFFI
jgi:hypothetical protein